MGGSPHDLRILSKKRADCPCHCIMEIRPVNSEVLNRIAHIDGTIESSLYLHVERGGEGLSAHWKLEERPLRQKLIERNLPSDEQRFMLKQIVTGIEEGIAL